MRKEKIEFKGIARVTGDLTTPPGALEELINMRTEGGCLKAIGGKKVVLYDKAFTKIIEHTTADYNNLVAISGNYVVLVSKTTGATTNICSCTPSTTYLATLNNMLIINDSSKSSMVVYQYKAGAYSTLFNSLPSAAIVNQIIDEDYNKEQAGSPVINVFAEAWTSVKKKDITTSLLAAMRECRTISEEYTEGYILISANYTLYDGSETKMTPPQMIVLGSFDPKPFGEATFVQTEQEIEAHVHVSQLFLSLDLPTNIASFQDLIKSVNIYCTNPITSFRQDTECITYVYKASPNTSVNAELTTIERAQFNSALFENLLFYRQHSINISEVLQPSYQIKFGDTLTTGKTMLVDSTGWINTVGKPFIYNNRQHLFDYKKTLVVEPVIFNQMSYGEGAEPIPEPTTTEGPYEPTPNRTEIFVYGSHLAYDLVNGNRLAWENGSPGFAPQSPIYLDDDGFYYTADTGAIKAAAGHYLYQVQDLVNWNGTGNLYIAIEPEPTTEPDTTQEATTTEEDITTTEEPTTTEIPGVASVTTNDATNITATTADVSGEVTAEGTESVTESGICWSLSPSPTINDHKVALSSGISSFSASLTGLSRATTHYFRAYAISAVGEAYGAQKSFLTLAELPSITTRVVDEIINTSAHSGGDISDDGDSTITEYGICWGTSQNPTTAGSKDIGGALFDTSLFNANMINLTPETTYYVRAYAINAIGTAYGNQRTFATVATTTRTRIPYYGFNALSYVASFNSDYSGDLWLDANGKYYAAAYGDTYSDEGYYVTTMGSTAGNSTYHKIEANGVGASWSPPDSTRITIEYFGYGSTAEASYESGLNDLVYRGDTTGYHYTTQEGTEGAPDGYYMTYMGATFESSVFIHLINSYQV